jgi:hypothetical protein
MGIAMKLSVFMIRGQPVFQGGFSYFYALDTDFNRPSYCLIQNIFR